MKYSLQSVLLVLLGAIPCLPALAAPAPVASPPAPAGVSARPGAGANASATASAAEGAPESAIRIQLLPQRFTTLAAEIGAKVQRVVPEGERFRAGQVIVAFDCTIQAAQLRRAEAAFDAANQTWESNKRLVDLNAVGRLEMKVSKAEMEKNQAEVAASAAYVSKCKVTAPFSGRVAEQKVREQQYAQPGQALLEIIDDGQLEVEFIAPSKWMAWLKPGHVFKVRIDETTRTYPAKVKRVGARVDPVSQSVKVLAVIDGNFPDLVAGMSGRATFPNNPASR